MSEKRFKVIDNSFSMWIVDTTLKEDKHEGAIYTAYDMCRKLNELHEENVELKRKFCEIMNQNRCDHKKAIIEFCKFMNIDSPLLEVMVDEFLQEVYEYE